MAKGRKTGGRKKGSVNKKTLALAERAEALGVDPWEVLLLYCKGDWQALGYKSATFIRYTQAGANEEYTIPPDLRFKAVQEANEYLHPKRKALEITETKHEERPLEDLSDEELDSL